MKASASSATSLCHCEDCRKSAGAPFVTWASFQRSSFKFTKGDPLEIAWAGRVRSFCAVCGSTLTFTSKPDADEIDVTVATFDQPESASPADHIWTEDRISWIKLADNYHSMHEAERNELGSLRIRALAIGAQSVGALSRSGRWRLERLHWASSRSAALSLVERRSDILKSATLL